MKTVLASGVLKVATVLVAAFFLASCSRRTTQYKAAVPPKEKAIYVISFAVGFLVQSHFTIVKR